MKKIAAPDTNLDNSRDFLICPFLEPVHETLIDRVIDGLLTVPVIGAVCRGRYCLAIIVSLCLTARSLLRFAIRKCTSLLWYRGLLCIVFRDGLLLCLLRLYRCSSKSALDR